MFDPTVSFHLDMVALEAGMTMYEIENGITDEYLRAVESFNEDSEEAATEGASFMSGLFEDDFVATEGFKETMGKVGKGIKAALITIGGAIKKVFLGLARTIKSSFQALIEKISRAKAKNDPWVAKLLANGEMQKVVNAISKTFNTAASTVAAASQILMPIVKKINSALNKAAIGNSKKADAYDDSDVANVGKNYIQSNQLKNRNDQMGYDRTEDEISAAKEQIKKLEDMYTEMDGAVSLVNEAAKKANEIVSAAKKAGLDKDTFKTTGTKTNSKGEEKETLIKKEASGKMFISALLSGVNAAPINSVAKRVATECSVHAKACDNIVNQATGLNGDTAANTGYRLCQIYLNASKVFSKISLICNKVFIFKVTDLSDENKVNTANYILKNGLDDPSDFNSIT